MSDIYLFKCTLVYVHSWTYSYGSEIDSYFLSALWINVSLHCLPFRSVSVVIWAVSLILTPSRVMCLLFLTVSEMILFVVSRWQRLILLHLYVVSFLHCMLQVCKTSWIYSLMYFIIIHCIFIIILLVPENFKTVFSTPYFLSSSSGTPVSHNFLGLFCLFFS